MEAFMKLEGKIALVTGAASGIGRVIAETFVTLGVRVIFVDANPAVQDIASALGQIGLVGDITSADFRKSIFHWPEVTYGEPASIGVFAAGITRDGLALKSDKVSGKPILFDENKFDMVLNVNLKAPVYCALQMVARLSEAGHSDGGKVIFIGSISSEGNIGQVNYATSKAGLVAATKTLNLEWKKLGVKVAVIHPGFTATPMVAAMPPEALEKAVALVESGTIHSPQSVADAVLSVLESENPPDELFLDRFKHASSHRVEYVSAIPSRYLAKSV